MVVVSELVPHLLSLISLNIGMPASFKVKVGCTVFESKYH